jgi:hypothetical protein
MLTRARLLAIATIVSAAAPARAERVVAVAPLSTLGTEDTSAAIKKLTTQIEASAAALAGTRVVASAQVADAIKKARKPQLKACEGDSGCLAELGKLVGAQIVISGEVGGLGDSKVVYLGATDVGTSKELRSTTLAIGAKEDGGGPAGAVIRLLDPDRFRGTLHLAIDVSGATIYVNGTKTTPSAKSEIVLPVGTQAVRVTHPEYHDFVRFIDVAFGRTTEVPVGMQQYPIIRRDLAGKPINRDQVVYIDPPRWRRWYVVGPAAVGLAILTGVIVGAVVHDSFDIPCKRVGGGACD